MVFYSQSVDSGYVASVHIRSSILFLLIAMLSSLSAAQSVRPGWAATPYADAAGTGVTFRLWAPHATNVHVGGTFNGWNSSSHPLVSEGASGLWSADITDAGIGDSYSYIINNTLWKQDPRAQLFDASNTKNPVVMALDSFDWGSDTNPSRGMNEMIIYEMHAGTFFDLNTNDTVVGTLSNAIAGLDYVASLGFNTIQLMPIHEYPGDTSWGYNPIYPHSVARPYGGPEALKSFVKACHERGLSVLLDVVHNHWGPKSSNWGMWQLDGWFTDAGYGGLYFYNTASLATTPWGVTRPNYGEQGVRDYILDSFSLFLEEYHVDGFRWDTPYHIARDNNNSPIPDGESLISEIIDVTESNYPHVIHFGENAEFLPDFAGHWDHTPSKEMGWMLIKTNDVERDMNDLLAFIQPDPSVIHVRYSESHDLVGGLNDRTRIPSQIDPSDPFSYNARKRSALGGIFTFTGESVPMAFQGQCMYETHHFSSRYPINWEYTNTFKETVKLYRDVIALRTNTYGLTRGFQGEETEVLKLDHTDKVIAYRRGGPDERQDCVVIANVSSNEITNYEVPLPEGMWFTHFNSDDAAYGTDYSSIGSRVVFAPRNPAYEARVTVAPYSALVMSKLQGELNLIDVVLDDGSDGNSNGQIDPAEMIHDDPVLFNLSDATYSNVMLTIASPHEDVVVTSSQVSFAAISPGETLTNQSGFAYRANRSLPCGTRLEFSVEIHADGQSVATSMYGRIVGELMACVTNEAPEIVSTNFSLMANNWTNGVMEVNDPEGDDVRFELLENTQHGLLTMNTNSGEFTFLPVRGFSGLDTAKVIPSDPYGSGVVASLAFDVEPEVDSDDDGLPDAWEQLHVGNPTNMLPFGHNDSDEVNNLNEFSAGTNPTDSNDYLHVSRVIGIADDKVELYWKAAGGVRYRLEQSTNLINGFVEISASLEDEMIHAEPGEEVSTNRVESANDGLRVYRLKIISN